MNRFSQKKACQRAGRFFDGGKPTTMTVLTRSMPGMGVSCQIFKKNTDCDMI
jgi:hypothetical protein